MVSNSPYINHKKDNFGRGPTTTQYPSGDETDHHGYSPLKHVLGWSFHPVTSPEGDFVSIWCWRDGSEDLGLCIDGIFDDQHVASCLPNHLDILNTTFERKASQFLWRKSKVTLVREFQSWVEQWHSPRKLTWNLKNDGFQKESPFPKAPSCHVSFSGEYNPYKTDGLTVTVTNEGLWGFLLEM